MATAAVMAGGALLSNRSTRRGQDRAASAQTAGQEAAVQAMERATARARGDAIPLFESGTRNALAGFQGALDVFGQSIPQQMQSFQQGNVGAQNALRQGLAQQQNAILGNPFSNAGIQTQQFELPDASQFQQQLPEFETVSQALELARTNRIPGFGGGGGGVGGGAGGGPGMGGPGGAGGLPQDDGRFFDFNFFNPLAFQ